MKQYIFRGSQIFLALPLIFFSIKQWPHNEIGQNVINLEAIILLLLGLQNITILYKCYSNSFAFEFQINFLLFGVMILGVMFQKYNRSPNYNNQINTISYIFVVTVSLVNIISMILIILFLLVYMFRQFYRIFTGTILSPTTTLSQADIDRILATRAEFQYWKQQYPDINQQCTICLHDFTLLDQCILLPFCEHCFHTDCIAGWLGSKATCPNCRAYVLIAD